MAAVPPAAGDVPPVSPIVGALDRFTRHRCYNRPIAMALQTDRALSDLAAAIANCSRRLTLQIPVSPEGVEPAALTGASLCNRRLCPFCEWRRVRQWRARLIRGLEAYQADYPKHRALFLTLTVRNCQVQELRATVQHLHASFKRLSSQPWFPSDAWFRRTEVTASALPMSLSAPQSPPISGAESVPLRRIASVHPHLHVLLLVKPSYFTHGYVKQLEWQRQWQMAARLDYPPVVDIRTCKAKPESTALQSVSSVSAAVEAAKYAAKATDLLALGDALPEFHYQMQSLRLYGLSQVLSRYVKDSDPIGEELLDPARSVPPEGGALLTAIVQWMEQVQEYRIAPAA